MAKILVPVSGTEHDEVAIGTAIQFAKPFNSHVKVLYVHTEPALSVPLVGAPLWGEAVEAIIEGQVQYAHAAAERSRKALSMACCQGQIQIVKLPQSGTSVTCSFQQVLGKVADSISAEAELSDLVVFGPLRWRGDSEFNEAFLNVLRKVQRPLVLANQMPNRCPKKIAIGWDGGPAAAHALVASIPYLEKSESVALFKVEHNSKPAPDMAVARVMEYLALHGVNAHQRILRDAARPIGQVLIEAAEKDGCDLIVMGGYNHSPVLEAIFGGATDYVVSHAGIPILMSH